MKFIVVAVLIAMVGLAAARLPPPDQMPAAASTPDSTADGGEMIEKDIASGATSDESSEEDDHVSRDPFHILRRMFNLRPMSIGFQGMPDTAFVRMQPIFPQNPYSIFGMEPSMTRNRPSILGNPTSDNGQFPSMFGRPFERPFEFPFPHLPHFPSISHPSLFDPQYEQKLTTRGYNTTKSFLPNTDNKMVIIRSVKNTTDTYAEVTKVRPFDPELDKDLLNGSDGKKDNDRRSIEPKPNGEREIEGSSASPNDDKPAEEDKSKDASSPSGTREPAKVDESAKPPSSDKNGGEKEAKPEQADSNNAKADDKSAENEIPKSGSDAESKAEDTPIITVNDSSRQ